MDHWLLGFSCRQDNKMHATKMNGVTMREIAETDDYWSDDHEHINGSLWRFSEGQSLHGSKTPAWRLDNGLCEMHCLSLFPHAVWYNVKAANTFPALVFSIF